MTEQQIVSELNAMMLMIVVAVVLIWVAVGAYMFWSMIDQRRRFAEWDKKFPPRSVKQ